MNKLYLFQLFYKGNFETPAMAGFIVIDKDFNIIQRDIYCEDTEIKDSDGIFSRIVNFEDELKNNPNGFVQEIGEKKTSFVVKITFQKNFEKS